LLAVPLVRGCVFFFMSLQVSAVFVGQSRSAGGRGSAAARQRAPLARMHSQAMNNTNADAGVWATTHYYLKMGSPPLYDTPCALYSLYHIAWLLRTPRGQEVECLTCMDIQAEERAV
jgi:hypothetical protein